MDIFFDTHTITVLYCETKEEMRNSLAKLEKESILLGEDIEEAKKFYVIVCYLDKNYTCCFGIGICSEWHGLEPGLLLRQTKNLLFLGFNDEVVCINVKEQKIICQLRLPGLFYRFVILNKGNIILIVSEIGMVAIKDDGQEVWRYTTDLITETTIKGDILFIQCMDSPPVKLNVYTGISLSN